METLMKILKQIFQIINRKLIKTKVNKSLMKKNKLKVKYKNKVLKWVKINKLRVNKSQKYKVYKVS